ncbi:M56 family metallopeptidase [Paludisphaera soli]|uniref:M56 family metallopeptidase n=1 Tax=Paludisphaera soli TaxID=2712865 RepID=UPI0013E9BCEB|nr:M56 family metallopeptidase [Paludisphaera soli]
MSATAMFGWLADAPSGLLLVLKATAVLTAAWGASWAVSRRNPRWRVLAWRAAAVGLVAIVGLTFAPPLFRWRVAPPARTAVERVSAAAVAEMAATSSETPIGFPSVEVAGPIRPAASPPAPVAAPVVPARPPLAPGTWLLVGWGVGCTVFVLRLAIGAWRLSRVVRRADAAPEAVQQAARAAAERLGMTRPVRVVETRAIASPCLTGVVRPVILLPAGRGLDAPGPDLDAVLVHELTHVRNGDLFWNDALHLASIVLWFHPLAWRIRAAHASACDAVCDAVAVDQLGDVATYARALARLALQAAHRPPARGLAMARAGDVRRRIAALQRMVHRSPLPRSLVMPALLLCTALAALIGGTAVLRAQDEPPAAKPDAPASKTLTVRALDAETGEPLEGVEVEFQYYLGSTSKSVVTKVLTSKAGEARTEYDRDAYLSRFSFSLRKPGFVPAFVSWTTRRPIVVPDVKELRLARGRALGGVVFDAAGAPIEGAEVKLSLPATESDIGQYNFILSTAKTDARGRWGIGEAPADLRRVSGWVQHPDYIRGHVEALGSGESTVVLREGATVTGRVVGPDGKPAAGAKVTLGGDRFRSNPPESTTDAEGRFSLKPCEPGAGWVFVEAPGFAPAMADVLVRAEGETPPATLTLEPGSTLRVRVVDREGKPLEGVAIGAESWRDRGLISFRGETDAEGRVTWKDAPRDAVQFSLYRRGLMAGRKIPLSASDEEHVVTMNPELAASGSVIDAATRKPIPRFRVIQGILFEGRDEMYWRRGEASESTDGRYSERFNEPNDGVRVRIEAPGYKPAESRVFRADEGAVTEDFALVPQAGLEGVVLGPDGKPAAGAEVALGLPNVYVGLEGASFGRAYNTPIATTDAEGRFSFPKPEGDFLVVAAGEAGFAEATPAQFAKSPTIRLAPWGRIEGRVMIGKKPGAGELVTYQPDLNQDALGRPQINVGYNPEVRADSEGRFVIDKVVPKPGRVGRVLITKLTKGMTSHMPVGMKAVDVKPGETARVDLGGDGRTVVGRVVAREKPERPIDWGRNQPARIMAEAGLLGRLFGGGVDVWKSYGGNFDADGRFRAEDVPPGRYKLIVSVDAPARAGARTIEAPLGRATHSFTVPEGDQDAPVDIGEVPITLDAPQDPAAFVPLPRIVVPGPVEAPKAPPAGAAANGGRRLRGKVFDEEGRPVAGAVAVLGANVLERPGVPAATTDEDGEFVFEGPEVGPTYVTVQAGGHGPQWQGVRIEEAGESPPVVITLGPPTTLRVRVVDSQGAPVADARVAAHTWRGRRVLRFEGRTDAEGRLVWPDAPRDGATYHVSRAGYMTSPGIDLGGGRQEYVVELRPTLRISGKVVDAATGRPIPRFTVVPGYERGRPPGTFWSRDDAWESRDGAFSRDFGVPYAGWRIRIEASGYRTASSSVVAAGEVAAERDFALEVEPTDEGLVLLPDGKPAGDAQVVIVKRGSSARLVGTKFDPRHSPKIGATEADGRFRHPRADGECRVFAASPAGFAELSGEAFAEDRTLRLAPWGRVEGRVLIGRRPGAGERIDYEPDHQAYATRLPRLATDYGARADADGRFVLDNVIPGPGTLYRTIETPTYDNVGSSIAWQGRIEAKPGETTTVTMGGQGRAVVGRVRLEGGPPGEPPIDWRQVGPVEMIPAGEGDDPVEIEKLQRTAQIRHAAPFDPDGRFRIDDVAPGRYWLTAFLHGPVEFRDHPMPRVDRQAARLVVVPEGEDSVPVDAGEVAARPSKGPIGGPPAPG